ncbi:RNA polymerase sigma factor [Horticoccus sp. 23ND18S-11]|uniref:RNA polymerase sigma factor n=1 Tax=Horticoccus sp. 23ND18S-11 TaxID=3391832 RepID=UPI0039C926C3
MSQPQPVDVRARLDAVYRTESGRILATLIRLLGDFALAEDAMHDAFSAALHRWPVEGLPANPRAWLISAGRFKGIDALRRRTRLEASHADIAAVLHGSAPVRPSADDELPDDQLRLIFTCCHPVLAPDSRAALTLREVCGLTTEEIARAFLSSPPAMAQRIVRAKARIRDENIPFQVPSVAELPVRLGAVLTVVYLLFNEGYAASSGPRLTRVELSAEAIRLGRVMLELLPDPEVVGLLALMLLHEARRLSRVSAGGEIVLLEHQDRSTWNRAFISEGIALVERALATRRFGPFTLQAAIAAVHAEASTPEATDWRQICALYAALLAMQPSPVIALNRAAAVAMHEGPVAGLALIDAIVARGELRDYHLLHAARADLHRRLGRRAEARAAYAQAYALAKSEPERRFLEKRLRELE